MTAQPATRDPFAAGGAWIGHRTAAENDGNECLQMPTGVESASAVARTVVATIARGQSRWREGDDMVIVAEVTDLHFSVRVLGRFVVTGDAGPVTLPQAAQRLVAWLVVHPKANSRPIIAARLWPDLSEIRSMGVMRSALWHLRHHAPSVVEDGAAGVRVAPAVRVDLWNAIALARLLPEERSPSVIGDTEWARHADDLADDLLPDWPDEWLVLQRERHRQMRLHALERLGRVLLDAGRTGEAIEVALIAVAVDPLRESAQRILIEAHLSESNLSEAVRQFRAYQRTLEAELGVQPSAELSEMVPTFRPRAPARTTRPAAAPGRTARPDSLRRHR